MASPHEIRLTALKASNASSDIDKRRSKTYTDAKNSASWWRGSANNAFIVEYNKINNDIHMLLDAYGELAKQLKTLADAIEEAETVVT